MHHGPHLGGCCDVRHQAWPLPTPAGTQVIRGHHCTNLWHRYSSSKRLIAQLGCSAQFQQVPGGCLGYCAWLSGILTAKRTHGPFSMQAERADLLASPISYPSWSHQPLPPRLFPLTTFSVRQGEASCALTFQQAPSHVKSRHSWTT